MHQVTLAMSKNHGGHGLAELLSVDILYGIDKLVCVSLRNYRKYR